MLEYASPVWKPTTVGLQKDLERVKRYFTKGSLGWVVLSYDERLAHLNLDTLVDRRNRVDFISDDDDDDGDDDDNDDDKNNHRNICSSKSNYSMCRH